MKFNSNAEEIRYYIKQLLDDGEEKTTQEIDRYVRAAAPDKTFTQGMISGSRNDLIKADKTYRRLRRGIYQKITVLAESNGDEFDMVLKEAIENIKKALTMDISGLTPETLVKNLEKSKRYIDGLEQLLETT